MILSSEQIDNKAQALTDYCENHHPGLGDAISGSVMIDVEPYQVQLEKLQSISWSQIDNF
jgi:hypothetical protein